MEPNFNAEEYRALYLAVYVYHGRRADQIGSEEEDLLEGLIDKIATLGEITEEEQQEMIEEAEII